jgi:ABC-type transport system substrate-binding protein
MSSRKENEGHLIQRVNRYVSALGKCTVVKSNFSGMDSPELEELTLQWRREVDPAKRRELAHAVQHLMARDMLWCNMTDSPYFQAYRDNVKGYHFMNQVYVYWETTWLEKA